MSRMRKMVAASLNALGMILRIDTASEYYNRIAGQGLAPAQVDGFFQRHRDPCVAEVFALHMEKLDRLIQEHDRVLDVGCGTGKYLSEISKAHAVELYGVDVSRATIENYTKPNCPNVTLAVVDFARQNPFPSVRFDLVYSISVLQHVPFFQVSRFFKNVAQALRPGGVFYLGFAPGDHWTDMFAGRHYHKYPPGFVQRRLRRSGLAISDSGVLESSDKGEKYGHYFTCVQSPEGDV